METIVDSSEMPPDPQWMIWGKSYTAPAAARFSLNFLGRNWFNAKLPPSEALTLVRLLVTLYAIQKQGLLLSKKDVMRAIDAEHISTAKRYTDLAIGLGFVTTENLEGKRRASLDSRIQLLYLTPAGQKAVEDELEVIKKSARWLVADLEEYRNEKGEKVWSYEFGDSITVEPPKLEQLAIVNDELVRAPPGSVPPMREALAHEERRKAWMHEYVRAQRRYRPLTAQRWIAGYSETLRFDKKNREALSERAETNFRMIGGSKGLDAALADLNELVPIDLAYLRKRAEVHLARGNLDQAIADIDQLLLDREAYPGDRMVRAEAYAKKGEWEKAAADIDAAVSRSVELLGKDDDLHWREEWQFLRGAVLANVGRVDEAIPVFQKAREGFESQVHSWEAELNREEAFFALTPDTVREWRDEAAERIARIDEILKILSSSVHKPAKGRGKGKGRHR